MSLDDLLGLLFVFFFIVLPALQGLFRRNPPPDLPFPVEGEAEAPPPPPPPPRWPESSLEVLQATPPRPPEVGLREAEPGAPFEEAPERPKGRRLGTRAKDVVQGMIWHEILKKPKGL
ncbi:hypothetical protein TTMY_0290 [Thermus thermophilus]|uniref:hypothetical protein n=1 Tax=Thermus thermophilus TaxID=274 RepID=UPI000909DF28|nr:hypothetical protein [Thermus thermophilus]BAW00704.1 hypothetical protein TTMY_0290 [Thermus thermophilus]BDB11413.1 hypothetical protein TthTMY_11520 [Thermus thermophilus]